MEGSGSGMTLTVGSRSGLNHYISTTLVSRTRSLQGTGTWYWYMFCLCLFMSLYFLWGSHYIPMLQIRRLRTFLGLLDLDPDPLVRGTDQDPSIIKQKVVRNTLIPAVFRLLYDFLSLKHYVNIPSKSNMQKNFLLYSFLFAS